MSMVMNFVFGMLMMLVMRSLTVRRLAVGVPILPLGSVLCRPPLLTLFDLVSLFFQV